MKTIKEDQLFWTREVYERVLFQQLKTPRDPKGKGKGKDKGKKGGKTKGVYQDHLKNNPGKGNGKNDKSSKGGRPNGWPQNWALQAPNGGLILSWLEQRSIPLEESEDSFCFDTEDEFDEDALRPPEVLLGEAGDVMAEFENDGSDSELERDELKAAGVHRARGDSPASQSSSEGSGDEK
eukprot:symbB.v1.2.041644.t1/scaffold8443.1/size6306/1